MHVDCFLGSDSDRLEWQIGNDEQPSLYAHRNHCPTATTGRRLLRPLGSPKDLHTCILCCCSCSTVQHNTTYCKNEVYSSNVQRKKYEMCVSELNTTQVHCLCLFTIHMCVCMCETFFGIRHLESALPLFIYHVHVCVCVCVCARAYRVRAYGFAVAYYIDAFLCHMLMLSAMLWQIHTCAYAWVYACVVLAFCSNLYHLTGVLRTTYQHL